MGLKRPFFPVLVTVKPLKQEHKIYINKYIVIKGHVKLNKENHHISQVFLGIGLSAGHLMINLCYKTVFGEYPSKILYFKISI